MFGALMVFLKEILKKKKDFERKSADVKKHAKLPSMQGVKSFKYPSLLSEIHR